MQGFLRLLPTPDTQPVIGPGRLAEERLGRGDKECFALCRRLQCLGLLYLVPSALQLCGTGTGGPQRLEQGHGHAPVRHRAIRIGAGDLLERGARLRIGHVMQQRGRAIELRLRGFGTGDGKVDHILGVVHMRVVFLRIGRGGETDQQSDRGQARTQVASTSIVIHRQVPEHTGLSTQTSVTTGSGHRRRPTRFRLPGRIQPRSRSPPTMAEEPRANACTGTGSTRVRHLAQTLHACTIPVEAPIRYSVEVTSPPRPRRNSAAWSACSAEKACTTTVVLPDSIASRVAPT